MVRFRDCTYRTMHALNTEITMFRHKRVHRIAPAVAGVLSMTIAGCGTAINSSSSSPTSPSGTIQSQSQPPTGPILGYVWDAPSQSLRPIQGLAGASIIGAATISAPSQGTSFIASATSGVSGMALFLDANGGVFQGSVTGGPLTKVGSVSGATSLILSNSGAYAVVTGKSADGASIASVISGLPTFPSARNLNLASAASVFGAAASDTGTVALATGSSQGNVSIVAFVGQAAGAQVATTQAFGGMQFVPNRDELVVADGGSGVLTAITRVNTTASSSALSLAGGITAPVALDITSNGRWVVAANHNGDVLRIDLTGVAAATKVHCSCAPGQVLALNGSANGAGAATTVRLVTAAGGPLWIVDAGNASPRVLFIPAITTTGTLPTLIPKSAM
jgi:hypothetical protein